MKYKLGNWPYPGDVPVYLQWIKSPMRGDSAQGKQWLSKVLFMGENEKPHERLVPWGYLPELKLGSVYCGGGTADVEPAGKLKSFELNGNVKLRKISAELIQTPWIERVRKYQREFLFEQCVEIREGATVLIIPCVEIIRSFFAINKQLANLLLEPAGLAKCCAATLENGFAHLEFNREIPLNSLNAVVINRIAAILHHSQWWDCWQQVWSGSKKNSVASRYGQDRLYLQLSCMPPIRGNSVWNVRGEETDKGFFVMEIIGVQSYQSLPFYMVTYSHPNLQAASEKKTFKGSLTIPDSDADTEAEIDSSTAGPKGLSQPVQSTIRVTSIQFGNPVVVRRKCPDDGVAEKTDSQERQSVRPKQAEDPQEKISLNDEGGIGTVMAGEFSPLENLTEIPAGLRSFIDAIKKMDGFEASVSCDVKAIPESSRLAKLGDSARQYAIAQVGYKNLWGYLLELDSSDGHGISTMVFAPSSGTSAMEVASKLLTECLAGSGYWNLKSLENNPYCRYDLAKHTSIEPKFWAHRLLTKLVELGKGQALNK